MFAHTHKQSIGAKFAFVLLTDIIISALLVSNYTRTHREITSFTFYQTVNDNTTTLLCVLIEFYKLFLYNSNYQKQCVDKFNAPHIQLACRHAFMPTFNCN